MAKKIVRITESDLVNIVKRVLNEQGGYDDTIQMAQHGGAVMGGLKNIIDHIIELLSNNIETLKISEIIFIVKSLGYKLSFLKILSSVSKIYSEVYLLNISFIFDIGKVLILVARIHSFLNEGSSKILVINLLSKIIFL